MLQLCPIGHALPHIPQLALSDCVLIHVPLQSRCPAAQPHAPAVHPWPAGHAVPQAPQFARSVCKFAHNLPQSDWPAAHTHVPAVQVCPAPHAVPHAPQFIMLVAVSTHVGVAPAGSQSICPIGQVGRLRAQRPIMQLSPAAHAMPQAPQFIGSTSSVAHAAPHIAWPGGHIAVPMHAPMLQVCPAAHMRPQPPQLATLDCTSVHAPPQFSCPAGHIVVPALHMPVWQLCPAGQELLQEPQCVPLVWGSTHSAPQRSWPAGHPTSARASVPPPSLGLASGRSFAAVTQPVIKTSAPKTRLRSMVAIDVGSLWGTRRQKIKSVRTVDPRVRFTNGLRV